MIAEGRIIIDLERDGSVRLQSSRTADVGKLMVGRSGEVVLGMLPLIFSLCGQAHMAAGRQAMALGSANHARCDAAMVHAENTREHLLRIMMGWQTSGHACTLPATDVMSLITRMQTAAGDPAAERGEADHLAHLLEQHVLGMPPDRFLRLTTLAELQKWISQTSTHAAAYMDEVLQQGWQGLGAVPPHFLPDLPIGELTARLAEPAYALSPDWLGQPRETGPLARQQSHPLVQSIVAKCGAGLLARLTARLVELAAIPDQIQTDENPVSGTGGFGVVETARGRLIHAARLQGETVVDYRILAPTEWNFHPKGVAVQALRTLGSSEDKTARARALVEAIDPCVGFDVRAA